jgi:flagellar biosynthetic protein FliQ
MDQTMIISIGKNALEVALKVSAPILGFGLMVGLLVSVFQAVTSIQDMTLTFIPKILAVALALALFLPLMLSVLTDFTIATWSSIPQWIR